MTTDTEIRTLQLEFIDSMTAMRFGSFCRRKQYPVLWLEDGPFKKASIVFQNKAERSNFLKEWSRYK